MKSFGPQAIRSKALLNPKNRGSQKAGRGRDANAWSDKQREVQAGRKEALLQSKAFKAICDRSDATLRSALVALKERDRQSEFVDGYRGFIIFDEVHPFFSPMIDLLDGVRRFYRPKPGAVPMIHCLDSDQNSDLFMPPRLDVPHLFFPYRPAIRYDPLFLLSLAERSLALDDMFQPRFLAVDSLVKRVLYTHQLAKDIMELEASKSGDPRYARVAQDETESYLLVDPNPEATRRYYDGSPQVEPRGSTPDWWIEHVHSVFAFLPRSFIR